MTLSGWVAMMICKQRYKKKPSQITMTLFHNLLRGQTQTAISIPPVQTLPTQAGSGTSTEK
jgi:hypothetical protein